MISIFNGSMRRFGKAATREIYARVDVEMRGYLHHFKGAKLAVFMAIALHADENGQSNPAVSLLEKETGYDRETIFKALSELCATTIEGQRLLARNQTLVQGGKFGPNCYTLFPESETPYAENPCTGKPYAEKADTKYNQSEEEPILEKPTLLSFPTKLRAVSTLSAAKPKETPEEKAARIATLPEPDADKNPAAYYQWVFTQTFPGELPDIDFPLANKRLKLLIARIGVNSYRMRVKRFLSDRSQEQYGGYGWQTFISKADKYVSDPALVPQNGNSRNGYHKPTFQETQEENYRMASAIARSGMLQNGRG